MREIKFRIYNPSSKSLLYDLDNVFECLKQQIAFDKSMPGGEYIPHYDHRSEGMVWEQFTGLHDKNGKEVYEGDVYYRSDSYMGKFDRKTWFKIAWADGGFCEEVIKAENSLQHPSNQIGVYNVGDQLALCIYKGETTLPYEIIGDVHSNPELLKQ